MKIGLRLKISVFQKTTADEAHRTQYGFKAKTIDAKNEDGEVVGKRIVYGFAKYMRDALPNATYLGFTGTPIENTDVNTPAVFDNYVDLYDIAQAGYRNSVKAGRNDCGGISEWCKLTNIALCTLVIDSIFFF